MGCVPESPPWGGTRPTPRWCWSGPWPDRRMNRSPPTYAGRPADPEAMHSSASTATEWSSCSLAAGTFARRRHRWYRSSPLALRSWARWCPRSPRPDTPRASRWRALAPPGAGRTHPAPPPRPTCCPNAPSPEISRRPEPCGRRSTHPWLRRRAPWWRPSRATWSRAAPFEAAARALFVHPNTVRYRLRRISQTVGWDPTDAREGFVLQIALVLGRLATDLRKPTNAV